MDVAAYPSIPPAIWSYYRKLLYAKPSHPLVRAIKNQGESPTWKAIDELLKIAGDNTGLAPQGLLKVVGFNENNLDNSHIQAVFGVLRTINMLCNLGFTKPRPLPAKKSTRECDLLAEYNGARYAIEVFRSSEAAYRFPNHKDPARNLQSYITRRHKKKRTQLAATMKAYNCSKALLIVVMDSSPAKQLTRSDEWDEIARSAYHTMGSPTDTHLLIFTGLKDFRTGGDDYAAYPTLDW